MRICSGNLHAGVEQGAFQGRHQELSGPTRDYVVVGVGVLDGETGEIAGTVGI